MTDTTTRQDADLALTVYLEPLLERRRVLVIGQLAEPAAARLEGICSRVDHIDPTVRQHSRGRVPELPFRDEAIDLVWVLDVAVLPEPHEDAIRELHRVVSRDGVLVACAPAASRRRRKGSATDQLEQLLSPEFPHVCLLAQAPVFAHSIEALSGRDGEIVVETSLAAPSPSLRERFVAFASDARLSSEGRFWVELPAGENAHVSAGDSAEAERLEQSLRSLEHDLTESARREADAMRALQSEQKAREEAERKAQRAARLEERLEAAEADFDDAVARVRWLESEIAEKEASAEQEHKRRVEAERLIAAAKAEAALVEGKVAATHRERDAARAEAEALAKECADIERRLAERAELIRGLESDAKQKETAAKDLLEELRRIEQHRVEQLEHDGRVTELEAERDRAVQRALDAEVAREAAQMHVDELRAQLHARSVATPSIDPATSGMMLGLKVRVRELEEELLLAQNNPAQKASEDRMRGEIAGLRLRAEEAERALESMTRANAPELRKDATEEYAARLASIGSDYERRIADLEERLRAAEDRADGLERELDEADRMAEQHAEDADRIEQLEADLRHFRRQADDLEDDLRRAQDELNRTRSEVDAARVEASARIELAQRKESEARIERDEARIALEEARTILAQLQGAAPERIDA